jgi:hypothetical protein
MRKWFINFLRVFLERKRIIKIVAKAALSEQIFESQVAIEKKEQDYRRELLDFHN